MEFDFVSGPLDGQRLTTSGSRFYLVPDQKDVLHYVRSDGTFGMAFGEHTYELKAYALGTKQAECYEHVGYKKPSGCRPAEALFHD